MEDLRLLKFNEEGSFADDSVDELAQFEQVFAVGLQVPRVDLLGKYLVLEPFAHLRGVAPLVKEKRRLFLELFHCGLHQAQTVCRFVSLKVHLLELEVFKDLFQLGGET